MGRHRGERRGSVVAPVTIDRSVEELREERRQLLGTVNMTRAELRAGAKSDMLTGEQWDAYERLREIDFLLGRGHRGAGRRRSARSRG